MDTESLIRRLAENSQPVRRLWSPWLRSAAWLFLALAYVAVIVVMMGPRTDIGSKLADCQYAIEQIAALVTSVSAALAAFRSSIPAFDRRIVLLPVVSMAVWFGTLGVGCILSWLQFGSASLSLQPDWICLPAIILVGAGPAVVMVIMLRRGAPLSPHLTIGLGGLAAAGLGNFGLRLFHPQDASIMVLVWQMGSVFILMGLSSWSGRLLLNWRSLTQPLRQRIVSS